MNAFLPTNLNLVLYIVFLLGAVVIAGFGIGHIKKYPLAVLLSWSLVTISIATMEILCHNEAPGFRMLSLIMITLFSMKNVVAVETYKGGNMKLSLIQWISFVVGWFGMRPKLFETLGQKKLDGGMSLVLFGASRVVVGVILLFLAKMIFSHANEYYLKVISAGFLLAGLSLILHFGILNISAGMWRFSGADTRTLFRSPLRATSLTEFWGKRWNLAFSEMTTIALYRPLRGSMGSAMAMVIAFIFSGLLHEMAISIPVKAGYGMPLLYFFIHGMVMLVEKQLEKNGLSISKNKLIGRIWVIFWLAAPLPILFHKAFIKQILLPIIS